MNIKTYFWDLSETALKETEKILGDPKHPKFEERMVRLLSRCDKPKEIFNLISRKIFIEAWPRLRKQWSRTSEASDFRDWWETVYEQLLMKGKETDAPAGKPLPELIEMGRKIRKIRLEKGWTQADLARQAKLGQPEVSAIEQGRKNITQETKLKIFRALEIDDNVENDPLKKERIERGQINNFFNWFKLEIDPYIERGKVSPDFFVTLPVDFLGIVAGSRIAVELTEFCRDQKMRRIDSEGFKLFEAVERARRNKPNLNSVSCTIFLRQPVKRLERPNVVKALLESMEIFIGQIRGENLVVREITTGILQKYISKLIIRKTDNNYINWNIANSAWLGLHENILIDFLNRTEKMLIARPGNVTENWLVITCEPYLSCHLGEPDKTELVRQLRGYDSLNGNLNQGSYNRIFIFERYFNRVIHWDRRAGWSLLPRP
jgi:transcriptional regulator with XRE-family HTH domain